MLFFYNLEWEVMKKISEHLAENLRRLRKEKGFTQNELAEKAGISRQSIHYIESQVRWPSLEMVSTIAKVLKVPESALFEDHSSQVSIQKAWRIISGVIESQINTKK